MSECHPLPYLHSGIGRETTVVSVIAGAEVHVALALHHDVKEAFDAAGHLLLIFGLLRIVDVPHLLRNLNYGLDPPAEQATSVLGLQSPHPGDHLPLFPVVHVSVQKRLLVVVATAQNRHLAGVGGIVQSLHLGKTESLHLPAMEQTRIVGEVSLDHRDLQDVVARLLQTQPCLLVRDAVTPEIENASIRQCRYLQYSVFVWMLCGSPLCFCLIFQFCNKICGVIIRTS
jgi:hypothetical protein